MELPDKETQKAIVTQALKSIEAECYSLTLQGEAMKTIGLVDKATELGEQLAKSMQIHAFYAKKLAELA